MRSSPATCATGGRWHAMRALPAPQTRAAPDGGRKAWPGPATPASVAAWCKLAWRFLLFQKDSALAQWYRARTADARSGTRKTLIVALARKLLIALWRFVCIGEAPEGVVLRPAS